MGAKPSCFYLAIGLQPWPFPNCPAPSQHIPGQPRPWDSPIRRQLHKGGSSTEPKKLPPTSANQGPGELTQPSCLWNTIYSSSRFLAKFILLLQQLFSPAPLSLATSSIASKKRFLGRGEWEEKNSYRKGNLWGKNPFRAIQTVQPKRS